MKFLAIISTTLLMPLMLSAQNNTNLSEDIQYAGYLVKNGRMQTAYPLLNNLIINQKRCHEAYYWRALAYTNDGNYKAALSDISQATTISPLNGNYISVKAQILALLGRHKQAAETYQKASRTANAEILWIYMAAKEFQLAHQNDKANSIIENHISEIPNNDTIKLIAAEILANNDNTIDALKILNTVTLQNAQFRLTRGITYCKADMNQYAIDDLNSALDLNPTLSDIYIWRGLAKYQMGKRTEARTDWETAIKHRNYKAKEYLEKYR
jgi:tetratricopeptide (TPR) repeat protein